MFTDIVFPHNNEHDFIRMARKLDIASLVFTYTYTKNIKEKIKEIQEIKSTIHLYLGILCDDKTIHKIRDWPVLTMMQSSDKNRPIFEKSKPDIVFDLESSRRNDFIHHRNSGLDQVLCKLAGKNNIAIAFPFSHLLKSPQQSQIFGRISQNIRFCRKYKINTATASFAERPYELRSSHDIASLAIVLGMHPQEAKDSLEFVHKKINGKS